MGTSDYSVGMCELWFAVGAGTGAFNASLADFRNFGNIVAAEIAPSTVILDHFKSYLGDKRKDKTVVVTKSIAIPFTFDEISEDNVKDFMAALQISTGKKSAVGQVTIPIEGRAILRFKTNIGQSFEYVIPRCVLKADGGLPFNVDSWMQAKFSLEILQAATAATSAPYGTLTTNAQMTASAVLSTCEASLTRLPVDTAPKVQLATSLNKMVGTYSTRVTVATLWAYRNKGGVHASNVLGYASFTATSLDETYPFINLWVRASRDFAAGDMYLGFFYATQPASFAKTWVKLPAQTTVKAWERQLIPLVDTYSASLNLIKSVGLVGTTAVDYATPASVQTLYLDDIRLST